MQILESLAVNLILVHFGDVALLFLEPLRFVATKWASIMRAAHTYRQRDAAMPATNAPRAKATIFITLCGASQFIWLYICIWIYICIHMRLCPGYRVYALPSTEYSLPSSQSLAVPVPKCLPPT